MADKPLVPDVDRREFFNGRWPAWPKGKQTAVQSDTSSEIVSILVHVRPERLDAVVRAIEALPGSEIYSRSPQGKLVVVIEAESADEIGTTLNTISSMPHVLSAALVFHGTHQG
jgi:nitrate reductase NapAB chaperone NapD